MKNLTELEQAIRDNKELYINGRLIENIYIQFLVKSEIVGIKFIDSDVLESANINEIKYIK